ncbi:hypothetical protein Lser_V15G34708 [Lactuca serriola]
MQLQSPGIHVPGVCSHMYSSAELSHRNTQLHPHFQSLINTQKPLYQ